VRSVGVASASIDGFHITNKKSTTDAVL